MEIIVIIILVILTYLTLSVGQIRRILIEYAKRTVLEDSQIENKKLSEVGSTSTTLNPLFSEEKIAAMKKQSDQFQEEFSHGFDELIENENKELKEHYNAKKKFTDYKPSDDLIRLMEELQLALICRNMSDDNRVLMIESNLNIFHQKKSIKDVEKQLLELPYFYLLPNEFDAIVEKNYKDFLKRRQDVWKNIWEEIKETKTKKEIHEKS